MHKKIWEQRQKMGGINASRENNQAISRQIQILENRLDKALKKYNEAPPPLPPPTTAQRRRAPLAARPAARAAPPLLTRAGSAQALAKNKRLRSNIDNLRRERLVFDQIYKKLERELADKKREMGRIIEVSNKAYEARDAAQAQDGPPAPACAGRAPGALPRVATAFS